MHEEELVSVRTAEQVLGVRVGKGNSDRDMFVAQEDGARVDVAALDRGAFRENVERLVRCIGPVTAFGAGELVDCEHFGRHVDVVLGRVDARKPSRAEELFSVQPLAVVSIEGGVLGTVGESAAALIEGHECLRLAVLQVSSCRLRRFQCFE